MRDLNKLPVPELIDGKPWDVGEAVGHHAGTDPTGRQMFVPIEDDCPQCGEDHARYIRLHELTHAKHSKGSIVKNAEKLGVGAEAYQLAEENFIEAITRRSYPDVGVGVCVTPDGKLHEVRDQTVMMIRNQRYDVAARMAIAAATAPHACPTGTSTVRMLVDKVDQQIFSAILTFTAMVSDMAIRTKYRAANIQKVAQMIERFLGEVDEMMAEAQAAAQAKKGKTKEAEAVKGTPAPTHTPGSKENDEIGFKPGRALAQRLSHAANAAGDPAPARWGTMRMEYPPRPVNLNKKFGVRKYRASPEGARVRNISRFYADQKVFGRKRRYKGGTLLVDTSGSMSFSYEDLHNIIHNAPATTIAIYAGASGRGFTRIVAKGGTAVEAKQLQGPGGNEVDGPALDWLAKQREPRIWLSDGGVCADNQQGDLYGDASSKCRKANIRRVRWLEQAEEAFDNPTIGVRSSYESDEVDIGYEEMIKLRVKRGTATDAEAEWAAAQEPEDPEDY